MKKVKVKFWCNGGLTQETKEIEIFNGMGSEEKQIQEAFEIWLDNNEDVGYEIIEDGENI